jgi:hypothetical protein
MSIFYFTHIHVSSVVAEAKFAAKGYGAEGRFAAKGYGVEQTFMSAVRAR